MTGSVHVRKFKQLSNKHLAVTLWGLINFRGLPRFFFDPCRDFFASPECRDPRFHRPKIPQKRGRLYSSFVRADFAKIWDSASHDSGQAQGSPSDATILPAGSSEWGNTFSMVCQKINETALGVECQKRSCCVRDKPVPGLQCTYTDCVVCRALLSVAW